MVRRLPFLLLPTFAFTFMHSLSLLQLAYIVPAACLATLHSAAKTADGDWRAYLGDEGTTQYSTLAQFTPDNVGDLRLAWTYEAGVPDPNNRSQIQTNPLIIDGVLYGLTPDLGVFALDAATGREQWRFDPASGRNGEGPTGVSRGLTWWEEGSERRLLFAAGRFLYALDPTLGQPLPGFGTDGRVDLLRDLEKEHSDLAGRYLAVTSPGAVYRDLIILGMRVSEGPAPSIPGYVRAFDVRTGQRRWIFHTIPRPGEFGHDTWPPDAWQRSGGANCWAGMAVDSDRGLVFVPTGSAAFDFHGGDRLGDNLFANCLLALDAATGRRRWHFQFVRHDVWDRDPPAAPVLCEVVRDGRKVAAVAQVLKSGHVWVFDRETGESLFPWHEVPVPPSDLPGERLAASQPEPLLPAPFARQVLTEDLLTNRTPAARAAVLQRFRDVRLHRPWDPPSEQGTIVYPGFDGGAEWGGPAVDPGGVLYVNSNEMAWIHQMVPTSALRGANLGAQGLYSQFCMSCHGPTREGNAAGNIPRLTDLPSRTDRASILTLLRSGKGMMPSFAFIPEDARGQLTDFLLAPPTEAAPHRIEHAGVVETVAPGSQSYVTTGYNRFLDPEGFPAVKPPWGTLNAIDLNTGDYRWSITLGETPGATTKDGGPTGSENYGGPVVTAGGLLFIAGTKDEKIRAFRAATGEQLWEHPLPAAGFATPAVYRANGRDFVVIACGGGKIGMKSGNRYVAFALPE